MSRHALLVTDVVKRYGGIVALDGVDLAVTQGEIHGLVGPNGSGKSTLLGIVAGTVQPDDGTVAVGDEGPHAGFSSPAAARKRGVELMPQELVVDDGLTVEDNVIMGGEPSSRWGWLDRSAARRAATEALELVGLDVPLSARAGRLAAAQKRMLMLARTLHRDAKLVIVDEPSAGLGPGDAKLVHEAVRRVRESGITVIYVSHYLDEVVDLVDRATGLRDGRVAARLGPGEVTKEALLEVIMGPPEAAMRSGVDAPQMKLGPTTLTVRGLPLRGDTVLDLDLRVGEMVGLAGLLGSGRDDVVGAITGTRPPAAGEVVTRARKVTNPLNALALGIGHLSGDRSECVIPGLDLREHVSLPVITRFSRFGLIRRKPATDAANGAMDSLGITTHAKNIGELSGGNQQRALLARWLLADVDVLVVDEPTVGVDVGAREIILRELRRVSSRCALLVSSSDPEELAASCDRIICLRVGRPPIEVPGGMDSVAKINAAIT